MRRFYRVLTGLTIAAICIAVSLGCDQTISADPVIVQYTGSITVKFNWTDGSATCAVCVNTFAKVSTAELGDFDYGPFAFSFDGVYLNDVLSGNGRTIAVWVTDASGDVIYRGVVEGVHITAGTINSDETADIYPKGWYNLTVSQPSTDWGLTDVKMSGDGSGWISGFDNIGNDGVVYRGGSDVWALDNTPSIAGGWTLNSIAPAGTGAWSVGSDNPVSTGIIIRNSAGLWYDDVTGPAVASDYSLSAVDFENETNGWAVGATASVVPQTGIIMEYNGAWSVFPGPGSLTQFDLFDVESIAGGDFIASGDDLGTSQGFVLFWDESAGAYTTFLANPLDMADCATAVWSFTDVYAISAGDWWAVGSCSQAPAKGIVFHFTTAGGFVRESGIAGPAGNWMLQGVWADAAGEVWAVGSSDTVAVILHKTGGVWSQVVPQTAPVSTTWSLEAVDFPATGWGYAVGTDLTNSKGVILRYGFPK